MHQASLTRFAWLSIAAAVLTIGLKTGAYLLTGSVGLLSDAMESLVNLAAALMALAMLTIAAHPPDEEHAYGHAKAEYFSSGLEGALILVAAGSIAYSAVERLFHPRPIEQLGIGLAVSLLASVLNLVVARILLSAGRTYRSITLEADARHLMTDVWTSGGVLLGILLVVVTQWQPLDAIVALLVAVNIIWSGVQLVRRSALGLLDTALPPSERAKIVEVLEHYQRQGVEFHALRTRQGGARGFMSVHILVPGQWTVQRGHHLLEEVEADIRAAVGGITVFTHLEPLEDPISWEDVQLDRNRTVSPATSPRSNG